jgi:predicted dehydrogenase
MTVVVGLIGITGYGRVHLDQILRLREQGRVHLAAVTVPAGDWDDSMRGELAGMGVPLYQDYRDMLRACGQELDLCCIPTPIHCHGPMTVDCLFAGTNVLVEKPLAGSLEDCHMIRAAQEETGLLVAVGFQNVYDPSSLLLKERLLGGAIGTVQRMSGYGLSPRSFDYYRRNNWAGKLYQSDRQVLDSPANNAMSHYLQWLLFMGGDSIQSSLLPTSIEAELYRANPIEGPDTVNMRVETSAGIHLRFAVSHASRERIETELRIEGSHGSLTWQQNGIAELCRNGEVVEPIPIPTHRQMQMNVVERVVDRLESGEGFICTPGLAEMHTRCIVAAHDSADVTAVPKEHISVHPGLLLLGNGPSMGCHARLPKPSFLPVGIAMGIMIAGKW